VYAEASGWVGIQEDVIWLKESAGLLSVLTSVAVNGEA